MYTLHLISAIAAAALLLLALWQLFKADARSPLMAAVAVLLLFNVPQVDPGWKTVLFWCVASLVSFAATMMLPRPVRESRLGLTFMALGALAGAFVGAAIAHAAVIVGSVVGAAAGAVALSRTARGAVLQFPSKKFFNYLLAKGFPAVIVSCIAVLVTLSLINFFAR